VGQLFQATVFAAAEEQRARWFSGAAALAKPLFSVDPDQAAGVEEELGFRRRHGLFWLLVNLARETPVVVVVDDAQWADEPSAAFVHHLATRLETLPVSWSWRPTAPWRSQRLDRRAESDCSATIGAVGGGDRRVGVRIAGRRRPVVTVRTVARLVRFRLERLRRRSCCDSEGCRATPLASPERSRSSVLRVRA
jgi:hypothetical protein